MKESNKFHIHLSNVSAFWTKCKFFKCNLPLMSLEWCKTNHSGCASQRKRLIVFEQWSQQYCYITTKAISPKISLSLSLSQTHTHAHTHTSSHWDIPEGESTCKIICHAPNMEQLLFGEAGSARYKIAETDKVLAICKGETKRFK